MKKQTKVLLAAAMMTMGATFSAMAATYDWQLEDGEWVCYNGEGDVYEDEWCESAGKDYYVGEDGVLVASQWVDEDYYVGSDGSKTVNAWKYILPEGVDADDEDAEAEWFYFGANGKKATGKRVIGGNTYYLDSETGIMLTGWVDYTIDDEGDKTYFAADEYSANMVFVNEDGARVANTWIKTTAPEDTDDEDADLYWYYITAKGKAKVGRALDINGETYFFDAEAKMLSGWVATTNSNAFYALEEGMCIADVMAEDAEDAEPAVYFCGSADQGWAKKSTWIKEYASHIEDPDSDDDSESWFWLDSKGKVYTSTEKSVQAKEFFNGETANFKNDGVATTGNIKKINDQKYAFNANGEMLSGLVEIAGNLYYFGDAEDGSMKTGKIDLEDTKEEEAYTFFFAKKDGEGWTEGAAVTGAAGGDLYIGGLLQKAEEDYEEFEVTIITEGEDETGATIEVENVVSFIVDEDGDIKTSDKAFEEVGLDKDAYEFNTKDALKDSFQLKVTEEV